MAPPDRGPDWSASVAGMAERFDLLAGAIGDCEHACHGLVRRLRALRDERTQTADQLRQGIEQDTATEAQQWGEATAAAFAVNRTLETWMARREDRGKRLADGAEHTCEAVSRLTRRAVEDLGGLAGGFEAARVAAAGRWEALHQRIEGVAEFLGLLAREHRAFQEELVTLANGLTRQKEGRRRLLLSGAQNEAAAATTDGVRALVRGDLALAERLFRQAWVRTATACSKYNLTLVLLLSGQDAAATELLEDPDPPEADPVARQALVALRAYRDGHYADARHQAEAGLAVDPGHVTLRQLASAAAARCGAAADALRLTPAGPSAMGFPDRPPATADLPSA